MALKKELKQSIMKKYARTANDTGSCEVQIALCTEKIKELTEHLKTHKKDFSSRRGLLKTVSQRRKLLKYLQKHNENKYKELNQSLGL
jgi:small subunit ribosomal protein S15